MTWGAFWNVYRNGANRGATTMARGSAARPSTSTRNASSQTTKTQIGKDVNKKAPTAVADKKSVWELPLVVSCMLYSCMEFRRFRP